MAKAHKETFFLVSSAGTGFFYPNRKNRKKGKGESKLKVKKYDPIARKHILFEDKKLSKLKKKFQGLKEVEGQVSAAPSEAKSE